MKKKALEKVENRNILLVILKKLFFSPVSPHSLLVLQWKILLAPFVCRSVHLWIRGGRRTFALSPVLSLRLQVVSLKRGSSDVRWTSTVGCCRSNRLPAHIKVVVG